MNKKYFLDLELSQIQNELAGWELSPYRYNQIVKWVYQKRVDSFLSCSDLPVDLRKRLDENYHIYSLKITSKRISQIDGTVRYGFRTRDGHTVYAVFLPHRDRNSVCISTQIGCVIRCSFCASGKVKFKRNLNRGEIIEQMLQIEKDSSKKLGTVLLMGMGEPMLNYENVVSALKCMTDFRQLGLGRRHITVSTVGFVPNIRKLAEENLGVRLALSLHAPDDETRRRFIPDKVPYSLKEIVKAGIYYAGKTRSKLTIEYVLLEKVNDTLLSAQKFVKLLKNCTNSKDQLQINLIPCNIDISKETSEIIPEWVQKFQRYLMKNGFLTIIREAKGTDIGAGCGQLGV